MEDLRAYEHKLGVDADGDSFKGHIATFNFFNFRVPDFDNIAYISTVSCTTCSSCPVEKAYT